MRPWHGPCGKAATSSHPAATPPLTTPSRRNGSDASATTAARPATGEGTQRWPSAPPRPGRRGDHGLRDGLRRVRRRRPAEGRDGRGSRGSRGGVGRRCRRRLRVGQRARPERNSGGFFLGSGVHNAIIRNLTIRDSYQGTWNDKDHDFDAIQMDGAHHVWIGHNDLRHMADGQIDSRKDTTHVTVSTGSARPSSATPPPTTWPTRTCTTTSWRTCPARTSPRRTATTRAATRRWSWRTTT